VLFFIPGGVTVQLEITAEFGELWSERSHMACGAGLTGLLGE
jgi:hypothetical protein